MQDFSILNGLLLQAHKHAIAKVVWVPPEYGDAIVCICVDGTFSVWEETDEGTQTSLDVGTDFDSFLRFCSRGCFVSLNVSLKWFDHM